jgi:ABC-2 type transport system ATP-binding protein
MTSSSTALSIVNLHTRYGTQDVLRGVDLEIESGGIYGLLGPNGAGKTTLIRTICDRITPVAGTVAIAGIANTERRSLRKIGLVPQEIALYTHLSIKENLQVFGRLSGLSNKATRSAIEWVSHAACLDSRMNDRVAILSGGWKRRANIACAILHRPSLLILDEPTVGVDVDARNALHELILELSQTGMGILLTTHDMDQAETLCSTVGFLQNGIVSPQGHPRQLVDEIYHDYQEIIVELRSRPTPLQDDVLRALGMTAFNNNVSWSKYEHPNNITTTELAHELESHSIQVREIRLRQPGLDSLFVYLTQQARNIAAGDLE